MSLSPTSPTIPVKQDRGPAYGPAAAPSPVSAAPMIAPPGAPRRVFDACPPWLAGLLVQGILQPLWVQSLYDPESDEAQRLREAVAWLGTSAGPHAD